MNLQVSIETVLRVTKLSVCLAYTWPPPVNAGKWEMIRNDIAIALANLSMVFFTIPVITSAFVYEMDTVGYSDMIMFVAVAYAYLVKIMVYRYRLERMQIMTHEMEEFVKTAPLNEKAILQSYVNKFWPFHVFVTVILTISLTAVIVAPLIKERTLPVEAVYPFSVATNVTMYYVVYFHQAIASIQMTSGLVWVDCQTAVMLWYASARLEILAGQFKSVSSVAEFQSFVQKHQQLLVYATDVSDTMSYVALCSMASSGLGVILCCILVLSGTQPLAMQVNYIAGISMYMTNLFICAWPAENILYVCELMANATYDGSWTDMSYEWMKNYYIILQRCHRPVKVCIGGFIPTLGFNFYGSFLSAVFSYYTTLRSVTGSD